MFKRSANRQLQTVTIARSSRALLACAVTTGLAFQVAAHPAKAEEQVTAEAYLADLVNKLSEAKDAVSDLELEMGGLRESANKARVDLSKAQKEAQKAQDSVVDARSRLTDSDKAVAKAQDDLDEIARSAYASGGDASPITLAAGEDAAGDSLDRASYIRLATERQQGTVDRLDLARTQTANEESQLRDDRATADKAVSDICYPIGKKFNGCFRSTLCKLNSRRPACAVVCVFFAINSHSNTACGIDLSCCHR